MMFRANTSFCCELPDGTERSFSQGDVVSEDDPVAIAQPDFFTTFTPQPGPGASKAPVKRTKV